jgi:hypothetical protein
VVVILQTGQPEFFKLALKNADRSGGCRGVITLHCLDLSRRFGEHVPMAQSRDALTARRRRLGTRVKEVHAALDGGNKADVPDAVAGALDALYDLWEYWQQAVELTLNQADDRVRGDADGETAAALVHARGAKTHVFEDFGHLTDTYGETYRRYYGVWRWQNYSDPRPRFAERDNWYALHVADKEIMASLEAALRWLSAQPELQ